jgi:hypothetical protein
LSDIFTLRESPAGALITTRKRSAAAFNQSRITTRKQSAAAFNQSRIATRKQSAAAFNQSRIANYATNR